ncbi:hypothetical protein ROHU_008678 [Labeo rohita]|uniref:Protein CUSTOS n=1 Tax=Labeo rohita TaxID=84645 RepID=A0A498M4A0_LABRO|nr:hypothetical protein ROHU_008678 [Labeo rohita]
MSESSSEDENADRLKEAVWSFGSQNVKISGKGGDNNGRQSRRPDVSKHEHDGNELGTTPEFKSHVAKKLGALMDRCISEVFSETVNSEPDHSGDEEGFRLFSTSAPGKWMEEPLPPPPPPKKRPIPSSSDSDSEMEMRFREAAVSGSDILASAAKDLTEKTEEQSVTKESVTGEEGTVTEKKKKKKKKKKKIKESTEGTEGNIIHVSEKQSNGQETVEQTTVVENLTKKEKKKKKRKKLDDDGKDCDE